MTLNPQLYTEVAEFISYENDLLDQKDYKAWLDLWTDDGYYIVPIDIDTEEFSDKLNFAYDDAEMRGLRVRRLLNGESVSSVAMKKAIRNVSRFRVLDDNGETVNARAALLLNEVRHDQVITYAADLSYRLKRMDGGFVIDRKVVRLLNAESHLRTVAFIF